VRRAAVNSSGTLTVSRDGTGAVLTEAFNGHTLHFAYDANENLAVLRTAGRTVTFDRDPLGRETTLNSGVTLAQRWDPLGRLTEQDLRVPDTRTPLRRRYRWRQDGFLTGEDDSSRGSRRFDLDPAGRITAAHSPDRTERYAYDILGNITRSAGQPDDAAPHVVRPDHPVALQLERLRPAGRGDHTRRPSLALPLRRDRPALRESTLRGRRNHRTAPCRLHLGRDPPRRTTHTGRRHHLERRTRHRSPGGPGRPAIR